MRISSSRMAQMLENTGAAALQFTPAELAELNSAVPAIKVRCRTGLNIHAYMSCVDNRMRVGRFNLKLAAR